MNALRTLSNYLKERKAWKDGLGAVVRRVFQVEDRLLLLLPPEGRMHEDQGRVCLVQIQPSLLFRLHFKTFLLVLCTHLIGFEKEHDVIYSALALHFNLFFSSRTN